MNRVQSLTVGIAGLVLMLWVGLSWGQVPPTNDTSDDFANTGGGSQALLPPRGSNNTAYGRAALRNNRGSDNTAVGPGALQDNGPSPEGTGANNNVGVGVDALRNNKGFANIAVGVGALGGRTTTGGDRTNNQGTGNIAVGFDALAGNVSGSDNIAVGGFALFGVSSTGSSNVAVGSNALAGNVSGSDNTAVGGFALADNDRGNNNIAIGRDALNDNFSGSDNTAVGVNALGSNNSGNNNTSIGRHALADNESGNNNIAIGEEAGDRLRTGSDNIYLGNRIVAADNESGVMRLGRVGVQQRTFIAGIADVPVTTSARFVTINNTTGQLGILPSSARYKHDIQPMDTRSQGLLQLRPVTFRYKQDPQGELQYGLIAEEVVKVYPELVTRGTDGEVETVQYHELIPLLLNELQHQQQILGAQAQQLTAQSQLLAELKAQNESLRVALVQQNAELVARLARLEKGVARTATSASR